MKRNEIQDKYKWKLEDIFSTDDEWEKTYENFVASIPEVDGFKGKLSDKNTLLNCLRFVEARELEGSRLYCYARMRRDEDGSNQHYVALTERAYGAMSKFDTHAAFITSEIASLSGDYLSSVIADKDFSDFDFMLKEIIREKQHILSDKEEKLLSMASNATSNYSEIFQVINNIEVPLPTIKSKSGEKIKLTHGTFSTLLAEEDRDLRKKAFNGMYNAYKSLINTIACTYAGSVKKDNFYAKARRYESAMASSLFNDDVPMDVYNQLIKAVDDNLSGLHRYIRLRKKALGLSNLHIYDLYVPIVGGAEMKVSYEQAFDIVLEGLAPLGEEYRSLLLTARDEGWIDVMENEGKRSGAYSWGCYGTHPYVLLNYTEATHSIFTLAHELGHSMHTYYSNKNWGFYKSQYQIFVAEVASTVNEVFLLKHLISTVKDKELKKYLLSYYVDMFRTTVFRQTMFAEFEKASHELESEGKPLTVNSLSDIYYELNKKYYGKSIIHDDDIRYEWARIPHFYTAFYVYKYATGFTSAINIVANILKDKNNLDRYKQFLCAGGSDSPYEILKAAGVDLAIKQPYEVAMKEFNETLSQLEKEF